MHFSRSFILTYFALHLPFNNVLVVFLTGIGISFDILGDIRISGLFDIHEYNDESHTCGRIKIQTGIMYLEALLFAIDKINQNGTLLYGNKLAARLFNSCSNKRRLKRNLQYAVDYKAQGMIGPQYSEDALIASVVMDIFGRPLISYSATDPDLDNRKKYANFYRTVPPYNGQIQVMIDMALHFKWSYVGFVYTSDTYQEAADVFKEKAIAVSICVPHMHSISSKHRKEKLVSILESVVTEGKVKVMFLFLSEHDLKLLLGAAREVKTGIQNLTFVASDSWGGKYSIIMDTEDVARGSLTIQPHARHVPEFEKYFMSLTPYNNERNIWFKEFWEHVFNCSLKDTSEVANKCSGNETIRPGFGYCNNTPVGTVIDAVYSYAHVFKKILNDRCISKQVTGKNCVYRSRFLQGSVNLRDIQDILSHIQFEETFENHMFTFTDTGSVPDMYDILNIKVNEGTNEYYYDVVGSWENTDHVDHTYHTNETAKDHVTPHSLFLQKDKIVWRHGNNVPPVSICSEKCAHGLYQSFKDSSKCCWTCMPCGANDYVSNNTCISCDSDDIPESTIKACVALPVTYLSGKDPVAATIMVISSIGVVFTFIVIVMFLKNFGNRVIKASGRELCMNMLAGILVTYLAPIIFFLEPSLSACSVQKIIVSFGLTLSFAPLALKLNRIYRIFQCSKNLLHKPIMVSPRSQLLISAAISMVGVLLATASVINDPPEIAKRYPGHREHVIKYCALNSFTLVINLSYSSILMVVSTWYAFKTRAFPENFNETRYIGFTMYTTCLVLCGSIPPFFITDPNGNGRIFILCFVCEAIATINLIGLFFPKLAKLSQRKVSNQESIKSRSTTFQFNIDSTSQHSICTM